MAKIFGSFLSVSKYSIQQTRPDTNRSVTTARQAIENQCCCILESISPYEVFEEFIFSSNALSRRHHITECTQFVLRSSDTAFTHFLRRLQPTTPPLNQSINQSGPVHSAQPLQLRTPKYIPSLTRAASLHWLPQPLMHQLHTTGPTTSSPTHQFRNCNDVTHKTGTNKIMTRS